MTTFTDAGIKRLPARETAYRHFESGSLPGFHLQVQPSGTKTFYLQVTRNSRRRFFRIGVYPAMPLSAARERARELLAQLEQGVDPRASLPAPVAQGTVEDLLRAWLSRQAARGRRRLEHIEQRIRYDLPATFLEKPAALVTTTDVRTILAGLYQREAPAMAGVLKIWLHNMFAYGLQADNDPRRLDAPVLFGLSVNPLAAIPSGDPVRVRDRSLSWAEIQALWNTDEITWPARQACRLLLLTGARVNEVAQASWAEFDLAAGTWLIPASRSKSKRDLLSPLTPWTVELLNEARAVWPTSLWLFPGKNMDTAKKPLCEAAVGNAVRRYHERLAQTPWQARDLRRTFKTLAGEVGLSLEIRNRIQGHALTDIGSRHYDRHSYLAEKRAALLQWEAALRERVLVMKPLS